MKVDAETFELWQKLRYWGVNRHLTKHLGLSERTIYSAINKGHCTIENKQLITKFLINRKK